MSSHGPCMERRAPPLPPLRFPTCDSSRRLRQNYRPDGVFTAAPRLSLSGRNGWEGSSSESGHPSIHFSQPGATTARLVLLIFSAGAVPASNKMTDGGLLSSLLESESSDVGGLL